MPATSKAQQAVAGIALAAKRGQVPKGSLRGPAKQMAKMPTKSLKHFAGTKTKSLPARKK